MRLIDAEPIEKFIEDGLNCKDPKKGFGHDAIDILTEIHCAPTICQPPNNLLTLEELREMDGEPVWITLHGDGRYAVVRFVGKYFFTFTDGAQPSIRDYGKTWFAYRRKPEKPVFKANPDWCDHIKRRFEKVT